MAEPIIITYNCRVITHMFAGGALAGDYTELNPKTIKNLLSYWWRATQFDTFSENVYQKQTQIFGGGGENSLKSILSTKVINIKREINKETLDFNNTNENSTTLKYITYGIKQKTDGNEQQNKSAYRYVFLGTRFSIQLTVDVNKVQRLKKVGIESEATLINELNLAMYAFSLIGGIGAKTRNGFGHFHIESSSINNLIELEPINLRSLVEKFNQQKLAKYTTLSKEAGIYSLQSNNSNNVLATSKIFEFGSAYKQSIESSGKVNVQRRYISLPRKGATPPPTRHSRAIFFTVIIENGQNRGYMIFLPYLYLSTGEEQVQFKNANTNLIESILKNNKN